MRARPSRRHSELIGRWAKGPQVVEVSAPRTLVDRGVELEGDLIRAARDVERQSPEAPHLGALSEALRQSEIEQ